MRTNKTRIEIRNNLIAKSALFSQNKIIKFKKVSIQMNKILKQLSLKIQLLKNIQAFQNLGNKTSNLWENKLIKVFLPKQEIKIKNKTKV